VEQPNTEPIRGRQRIQSAFGIQLGSWSLTFDELRPPPSVISGVVGEGWRARCPGSSERMADRGTRVYCYRRDAVGGVAVVPANAAFSHGTSVGCLFSVNTGAIVEDDGILGDWILIAPGACLGGGVSRD